MSKGEENFIYIPYIYIIGMEQVSIKGVFIIMKFTWVQNIQKVFSFCFFSAFYYAIFFYTKKQNKRISPSLVSHKEVHAHVKEISSKFRLNYEERAMDSRNQNRSLHSYYEICGFKKIC